MTADETETASWEAMAVVGRVARAHGRRGQVVIDADTDFPARRFRCGNVLYAGVSGRMRPFRIAAVRFHGGRPLVALDGVDTMDQAESLAGAELRAPEADLEPLPPGSYYHHQLIGAAVRTTAGADVGTVTAVREAAGCHRLLVRPDGGPDAPRGEIEVPLAEPICVRIDPDAGLIVVDPPDGLLELNRPRRG